ncbi:hypothetical protein NHP194003_05740 [Helicobacter suis]|nr:hypothetical protein NHP194003_05740 [Helicobacter suis]
MLGIKLLDIIRVKAFVVARVSGSLLWLTILIFKIFSVGYYNRVIKFKNYLENYLVGDYLGLTDYPVCLNHGLSL